jgi:uncharacterized protein (DUF1330 family)
MTAYVIVEASVLDATARDNYLEKVRPILKQFGGEFLAFGPWRVFPRRARLRQRHDYHLPR